MKYPLCAVAVACFIVTISGPANAATTGDIYRIVPLYNETVDESVTIDSAGRAVVEPFDEYNPKQRFIARITAGNIFNLFLEVQPWNWVEHIVEASKTVNIKIAPQVLDSLLQDGVRNVFRANYNGVDTQKWYVVPTDGDVLVGRIANLVTKFCLTRNGPDEQLTTEICDNNDPGQLWRLEVMNEGRCY